MTVADLMKILPSFPEDMTLVIEGVDSYGYSHIETVKQVELKIVPNPHGSGPDFADADEPSQITCLYLGR
jgi:hypothetical protein